MDKKELWEKVRVALEKGYVVSKDAAVRSAKTISVYAGEASQFTKHKVQEMNVNRKLAKEFATLGARVYQLAEKGDGKNILADPTVKRSISKTKQLDADLHKAQDKVKSELRKMRNHPKKKDQKK